MAPATSERFGDYELVERLGVGGMAETFIAIRRDPGGFEQRVCLKRILSTFAGDAAFVEMFLREARMSALPHHGHIARVLDFGIADDAHYLTLELIEGTDLRAALPHPRRRGESLGPGLTSCLAHALGAALDKDAPERRQRESPDGGEGHRRPDGRRAASSLHTTHSLSESLGPTQLRRGRKVCALRGAKADAALDSRMSSRPQRTRGSISNRFVTRAIIAANNSRRITF